MVVVPPPSATVSRTSRDEAPLAATGTAMFEADTSSTASSCRRCRQPFGASSPGRVYQ